MSVSVSGNETSIMHSSAAGVVVLRAYVYVHLYHDTAKVMFSYGGLWFTQKLLRGNVVT